MTNPTCTPFTPPYLRRLCGATALSGQAYRIAIALAAELYHHHRTTGYTRIRVGKARAARMGGCSERSAQRHLAALLDAGVIDRVPDGRGGAWTGMPDLEFARGSQAPSPTAVRQTTTHQPPVQRPSFPAPHSNPPAAEEDHTAQARKEWDALTEGWLESLHPDQQDFLRALSAVEPSSVSRCGRLRLTAPNDLLVEVTSELIADRLPSGHPGVVVGVAGVTAPGGRPPPPPRRDTSTGRSSPCAPSQTPVNGGQHNRPITRRQCLEIAQMVALYYGEQTAIGRRPTESLQTIFAWVIYHVTYGAGNSAQFAAVSAARGAMTLLRRGEMRCPIGFQASVVDRYVECATDALEGYASPVEPVRHIRPALTA